MDKSTEYRKLALEAKEQSERATMQDNKEAWLRIAHGWMALLDERERAEISLMLAFDAGVDAHGTGQKKSDASH